MSIDTTSQTLTTSSAEETEKLAEQLGQKLRGGEVIELTSDLGGGKTTFTRGLARGADSTSHVSSPTFKISNTYKAPKFDIIHYDLYRLPDAGLMQHELAEDIGDPQKVMVIEWSDVVRDVLPEKRLNIAMQTTGETTRNIMISCPKELSYLMPND